MNRRWHFAGGLLAAAAVFLLVPTNGMAQVRFGVGTPYGGVSVGGRPYGYGYNPGYAGFGYNRGYYNPGYAYSPLGTGYYGSTWGYNNPAFSQGYANNWYGGRYYNYTPNSGAFTYSYAPSGYQPTTGYQVYYPPTTSGGTNYYYGGATTVGQTGNTARIEVRVPADARIWFDGTQTSQTGAVRNFVSPPLNAGENYAYEIRAQWMENGREVNQSRRVSVRTGANEVVDFTERSPSRIDNITPASTDTPDNVTPSRRVVPADRAVPVDPTPPAKPTPPDQP